VMKHGGRVWAENNDNGGASFVLELPVTGQTASDKVPPPDWSHLQQSPTAVFHTLRSNHHILIVDDEPSVAQSVEEILRQAGFEVTTATEAQQALSLLEQNRYDVIISDLTMPQMDGQQFWQAVTERHPDLANRIIFSSGDSSSQRARAFLEDCGCSWVEKPFKPEGFLRLIQQTLPNKPEVCPSSAQENVACMSRFS
jgi:DNA-binding NtrC family response regulator